MTYISLNIVNSFTIWTNLLKSTIPRNIQHSIKAFLNFFENFELFKNIFKFKVIYKTGIQIHIKVKN